MYDLKIIISGLSIDFSKNEKYMLSTESSKIILPTFNPKELSNLDRQISYEIESFFENKNEIITYVTNSRFISINDDHISALFDTTNTICLLYGITLPHSKPVKDLYWVKFDFLDPSIQHIIPIIGATIERAI
jgi:hypothetical protein